MRPIGTLAQGGAKAATVAIEVVVGGSAIKGLAGKVATWGGPWATTVTTAEATLTSPWVALPTARAALGYTGYEYSRATYYAYQNADYYGVADNSVDAGTSFGFAGAVAYPSLSSAANRFYNRVAPSAISEAPFDSTYRARLGNAVSSRLQGHLLQCTP